MLLAAALLCFSLALDDSPETRGTEPVPWHTVGEFELPVTHLAVALDGKHLFAGSRRSLHAIEVKKEEVVWKHALKEMIPPLVSLCAGDEHIAYCLADLPGATMLQIEDGARVQVTGAGSFDAKVAECALTPGDRWIWWGNSKGQMIRITPGDARGWSTRAMKNQGVTAIAIDPKGKLLAVAGKDNTIRFVGAKSASVDDKRVWSDSEEPFTKLLFGPKGKVLFSGTESGELRTWKVSSNRTTSILKGHEAAITCLAVDPKGKWFASGDATGRVLVWSMKSESVLLTLSAGDGAPVTGLVALNKGKTLATAGGHPQIVLWDVSKLK